MNNVRNMTIGAKIRAVRLEKGFSQQKLQEKSGVERNFISLVENNHRSPSFKTLMRLSQALEVSVGYITDYDKNRNNELQKDNSPARSLSQVLDENKTHFDSLDDTQFFPTPIITEAALAAELEKFEEEHIEDYAFISSKWVNNLQEAGRYYCLWVNEEEKALPPVIEPGALVCMDSLQRDPSKLDGEIVVFHDQKGGCSIKRLSLQGDHILGISEAPMPQAPLIIPVSKQDAILGKVVWCWSKFEK